MGKMGYICILVSPGQGCLHREGEIVEEEFIDISCYVKGKWVTRSITRAVAVDLFQKLALALGELVQPQQGESQEGRLKVLLD